ncbi:MAG TPA: cytochrome b/b6 domain-containing protein [Acidimicrobiales bacterium]|jgi:formate dehydrogenase subunit gamma|nr:cytochrome b/b6 domain-containing protein [Acidimicrobiales bacterium]
MVATTRPSPDRRTTGWLARFDRVERAVHWVNAALFGVLILTGSVLYLQPLDQLVGRRALVENIHVWCGVALPVPVLLALAGPWGRRLRLDVRRFNRFSREDRVWIRTAFREREERVATLAQLEMGKFNAGQKLNAAWTAGVGLVMLGTGAIMRWYHPWPLAWRTGSTFVHDWLAAAIGLVVIGHIGMAVRDPAALRAIFTGRIRRSWAEKHAPAWLAGDDGPAAEEA